MADPDIVLLRQKIHGIPVDVYAAELRERLPDATVGIARTPEEERELVPSARLVSGYRMQDDLLDRAENLEAFACCFAGTGHLPLDAFEARDVAVTNASGVHGPNIAEYVVGALVSLARDFGQARRNQAAHSWAPYPSRELKGSTVTVVGLGAIGEAIVERLEPFGVDTIGVRYTPEKGGPTDEVLGFDDVHDALSRTEYLVLACPLTDATEGLIGREAFVTLPPDAFLVNIARGGVVDTDALVHALQHRHVEGAFLDVTDPEPLPVDHPLWDFDEVTITPHNAGHTPAYYDRLADIVAENYRRLQRGEQLENRVR